MHPSRPKHAPGPRAQEVLLLQTLLDRDFEMDSLGAQLAGIMEANLGWIFSAWCAALGVGVGGGGGVSAPGAARRACEVLPGCPGLPRPRTWGAIARAWPAAASARSPTASAPQRDGR